MDPMKLDSLPLGVGKELYGPANPSHLERALLELDPIRRIDTRLVAGVLTVTFGQKLRPSPHPPVVLSDEIESDGEQPGPHLRATAKVEARTMNLKEGLLNELARDLLRGGPPSHHPEEPRFIAPMEGTERSSIAVDVSFHELLIACGLQRVPRLEILGVALRGRADSVHAEGTTKARAKLEAAPGTVRTVLRLDAADTETSQCLTVL